MKILLVDPPTSPYSWNQNPAPPLGYLYLASAIKQKTFGVNGNHDVHVLSLQMHLPNYEKKLLDVLRDYKPHIVGFNTITSATPVVIRLTKLVREAEPQCRIVLGGYQATVDPVDVISRSAADYVIRGEGEIPFSGLINVIESGDFSKLQHVEGLVYRDSDGNICTNTLPRRIYDIDCLPLPDRSLVPMSEYKKLSNKFRAGGLISSRGCPWSCNFCYSPRLWGQGIYRSANNIVDEIQELVDVYDITAIRFEDDTFTTNRKRVFQICDEIERRGLNIEWEARTRTDIIDDEMYARMCEAGLVRLQVGIESINAAGLETTNKRVDAQTYENFFSSIRKADLGLIITIIVGVPNETPQQMLDTISWVQQKLTSRDRFIRCMFTPFPGTKLDTYQVEYQILSHDLAKYTMDIPLVTSEYFSYEALLRVKEVADIIMTEHGPEHTSDYPVPTWQELATQL